MRVVGPRALAQPMGLPTRKASDSETLAGCLREAGVSQRELFGWQQTSFRRVEAVSSTHVSLDFEGRAVAVPRQLLPRVEVDQWLRFERAGAAVTATVDLRATLRAEARLADLFQVLVRP